MIARGLSVRRAWCSITLERPQALLKGKVVSLDLYEVLRNCMPTVGILTLE